MVKIETAKLSEYTQQDYERFEEYVSEEKLEKINRFKFSDDRKRSLLAHYVVKKMISSVTGQNLKDIVIKTGEHGKPGVDGDEVYISISHSGEYVACAVADRPCGIDIEEIRNTDIKVAERFFTSGEYEYIKNHTREEQARCFCEIWTAKEAYAKLNGKGLGIGLDTFEIVRECDRYCIKLPDSGMSKYILNVEKFAEKYILSYCYPK